MVILGYIYFESMLFFLSFVRKRNCIMIERMETCQNNRSDGNELPSGPGAVLTQSRFLFFLCLWEILLYKLNVDSKTKCNVLVFKSSRFKEESVNFAS